MRILFERRFGSDAEVAKLRQQLLAARNGDGAWVWEKDVPSDALTTGLAICVLAKVGAGDDSSVFRDARRWLLASQQADGSWLTPLTPSQNFTKPADPERMKVRDKIYHYGGTLPGDATQVSKTSEFLCPLPTRASTISWAHLCSFSLNCVVATLSRLW